MAVRISIKGAPALARTFLRLRCLSSLVASADPDTAEEVPGNVLRQILHFRESYPLQQIKTSSSRRVVIDFSSPNIAKPFHAGHLRSTIIGNFVANLYEAAGHNVYRINYLGDWGTQCGIVMAAMENFGSETELEMDPLKHLLKLYVRGSELDGTDESFATRSRAIAAALEDGDVDLLAKWQIIRDTSVREYSKIYKRMGVSFDEIVGESRYAAAARVIAAELREKTQDDPVLYESVGRLLKTDGTSLYLSRYFIHRVRPLGCMTSFLSRDLAAVIDYSRRLDFDDMLYVVENGQHDHFELLFKLACCFDEMRNRTMKHVKFGRIRGLSTRKGNVVLLTELLDEVEEAMKGRLSRSKFTRVTPEERDDVVKKLAVSVVIINDFQQRRLVDYENPKVKLQEADGDTGVFIQYCHARLCSLEHNCETKVNDECDFTVLMEPEALELLTHLRKAPQMLAEAFRELEPVYLVQYLFRNAHLVNRAMKKMRVKNEPQPTAEPLEKM